MSFSDVHPGDPINASNVQQVIDALKGTAGKGVPLSPTAVNNATNYALTVENLEPTNSRALNVLKSDGSTLIKADATGVTLGSPISAPAASLPGSVLENGSVPNAALGPDVARANLLTNGGFEIWQRGNGPFTSNYSVDRWVLQPGTGSTMSVSKDTTNVDTGSVAAAAVTYTHSTRSYVTQILTDSAGQLAGRTVSFSVRVRTAAANAVQLAIGWTNPTLITTSGVYHSGSGAYATLTQTIAVPAGIGALYAYVIFDASCTAYLDNATLVVGSQPANYVPMHPADDLARCLRYYQRWGPSIASGVIASGQAFSGTQAVFSLPLRGPMGGTPASTVSANSDWQVSLAAFTFATANSLSTRIGMAGQAVDLLVNGTTGGAMVAGNATTLSAVNANAWFALEWNP